MDKAKLKEEVKSLYDKIDKCISELVIARGKRDDQGIADAHWRMESLMVNAQQMCSVILDSLQEEEPVSVWHDKDEEPDEDRQVLANLFGFCYVDFYHKEDKCFYTFGSIHKYYLCEVDKWAYIDDLLNLSTVERNGKNLKELKTMLDSSLSKMTKKDWNEFLDECESENPEKAAEEYVDKRLELVDPEFAKSNYKRHTKMGVRYFTGSDLEETYIDAANWQKKQMMKDAVALETEIYLEGGTTLQFKKGEIFLPDNKPKTSKFKAGDKVKLIIIKEE